jgi:predicted HTH transcriptional regulator
LSRSQPTQSKPYFDDRIIIENPGVLIPGLIEQWGSGIPVILEEAASQHLPPPLFEEVGLRFRVTLPLAQPSAPAQGQSRPRGAESGAESRAESGAESLAEGSLAALVLQVLGHSRR